MTSYTLITGASSGIGKATAERLAREGRNLILVARRKKLLEDLAKELKKNNVDILVRPCDLTVRREVEAFFSELSSLSLDAIINNAGLALGRDTVEPNTSSMRRPKACASSSMERACV